MKQPLLHRAMFRVIASLEARARTIQARSFLDRLGDPRAFAWRLSPELVNRAMSWKDVFPIAPKTILDVGAHTGTYSSDLADLFRPEFCGMVEPIPELGDLLERMKLPCRSKVFRCALGAGCGTARFHVLEHEPSSSLMQVNPSSEAAFGRSMREARALDVEVRTLEDVFLECELDSLDLLKLDVQGSEMEVLAGGDKAVRKTRMIFVELSFFEHYLGQPPAEDMMGYLHGRGFRLRGARNFALNHEGHPLQCDGLFVNVGP